MGGGMSRTGRRYTHSRLVGRLEALRTYYRERGYKEGPLEALEQGQITSFAKPLPSGRHHVRVIADNGSYRIDEHCDRADPERDPLGHLQDIIGPPPHEVRHIKKLD